MLSKFIILFSTLLSFPLSAFAGRPVPANLRALYNQAKSRRCGSPVTRNRYDDGHGRGNFVYCGDRLQSDGIIYITGPSSSTPLADMDIDCDGANHTKGDCKNDNSGQGQTAFKDEVSKYGIEDLDANKHGYVVLGNERPRYLPSQSGVLSLSVVAVVCNNQLFYGVWGDTNGENRVGEASISLAQACFPDEKLNGDKGHGAHDVLYVAFRGQDAKPGRNGAAWKARDFNAFEKSLETIGNRLVSKISAN
ncbi:hypothetical protein FQN57_001920 [Myotisia sp. PD_48]|nr:hypothetical protein FQN57_001920 [Myotisia sp. PD_48]